MEQLRDQKFFWNNRSESWVRPGMLMSLPIVIALSAVPASPLQVVRAGHDHVQEVLRSRDPKGGERLDARASEFIDFAELARRSLAEQWGQLTGAQQAEFITTTRELLQASYGKNLFNDQQLAAGSEQHWGGEKIDGNEARVSSKLLALNETWSVEYRLYRANAESPWRVYDVVTDDVSLVDTYRAQFKKVIAKKGYQGLLAALKARKAQLERGQRRS
jgi:phospholipid transport system substrate-binding protein